MKLLLVLGSDKTYDNVSLFLKPLGFEMIRYRYILKAMDNIDEIDPVGIIISAKDFPRHWKTMVCFVRYDRPKNECPIVILKGENFPEEELNKAIALDVNGLALESMKSSAELEKIQAILTRYAPAEEKQKNRQYSPESQSRFGFIFSNPADGKLVTGTIKTVSSTGIFFEPNHPGIAENLKTNTKILDCSFRAGKNIFSPVCAIRRTGKIISLEFLSFPGTEKEHLDMYLENLPPE